MSPSGVERFIYDVALKLSTLPGVEAVVLGGSRATGEHRPDSDFDYAIYYRALFNPQHLRAIGWEGTVSEFGDWGGGVMNGGAWLTIDGRHVDVHYRDLDEVEGHLQNATQGRFHVERLPFYLAGIPTYVLAAELALGKTVFGTLPKPSYPQLLREKAYDFWHTSALLNLGYAKAAYASRGDTIGVAGAVARAVVEESHARLAQRGEWVLNEKRIVEQAGLSHLKAVLVGLSMDVGTLTSIIEQICQEIMAS